jgi:hypothetical protein
MNTSLRIFASWILCACMACGHPTQRTTTEICNRVLDKIVDIELREQGFKDPALLETYQKNMREKLQPEMNQCINRKVRTDVLQCLEKAQTAEAVSHRCLR